MVLPRIELGSLDSESNVLPLHHRTWLTSFRRLYINTALKLIFVDLFWPCKISLIFVYGLIYALRFKLKTSNKL